MDPQTASLREAWLAWGRLLQAAEPPQPAWFARPQLPPPTRPRRWRAVVAGALAASLLIGIVSLGMLIAFDRRGKALTSGERTPAAQEKAPTSAGKASTSQEKAPALQERAPTSPEKAVVTSPKRIASAVATATLQWDDTLDEQIAQAGQDVVLVREAWTHRMETPELVQYRFEQFERDFPENRL
jgi:hypothetical protein